MNETEKAVTEWQNALEKLKEVSDRVFSNNIKANTEVVKNIQALTDLHTKILSSHGVSEREKEIFDQNIKIINS